jgi:hypothetical protein
MYNVMLYNIQHKKEIYKSGVKTLVPTEMNSIKKVAKKITVPMNKALIMCGFKYIIFFFRNYSSAITLKVITDANKFYLQVF